MPGVVFIVSIHNLNLVFFIYFVLNLFASVHIEVNYFIQQTNFTVVHQSDISSQTSSAVEEGNLPKLDLSQCYMKCIIVNTLIIKSHHPLQSPHWKSAVCVESMTLSVHLLYSVIRQTSSSPVLSL